MMKSLFAIGIFTSIFIVFANLAGAQELTVATTTWIPFAYEENGELTGLGTEIVRAVLNKAEIRADIYVYPWKRAIRTVTEQKNVMIYPLVRISEREHDFIWVEPIFNVRMCLYKLKKRTDITVTSLDDAKKHTIGVLREAAMHQNLRSHGFEDEKQLMAFDSNRKSVEMLFRGRIDLTAENPLVISHEAKKLGFSMNEVEEVFLLFENEAYMAFGRGSSDKYVGRLKNAFEALRADGTIAAVFEKYK